MCQSVVEITFRARPGSLYLKRSSALASTTAAARQHWKLGQITTVTLGWAHDTEAIIQVLMKPKMPQLTSSNLRNFTLPVPTL